MISYRDLFPRAVYAATSDVSQDFKARDGNYQLTREQRAHLFSGCEMTPSVIATVKQVHGTNVRLVTRDTAQGEIPEADSIITAEAGVGILIRTADCVPVFVCDEKHGAIGLVHAGWKGVQQGVVTRTLNKMQHLWGTRPADLTIALGPSIRACCYAIDEARATFFPGAVRATEKGLLLDMQKVIRDEVHAWGVADDHLHDCLVCTCCNDLYHSYRRHGEDAGRLASVMVMKEAKGQRVKESKRPEGKGDGHGCESP